MPRHEQQMVWRAMKVSLLSHLQTDTSMDVHHIQQDYLSTDCEQPTSTFIHVCKCTCNYLLADVKYNVTKIYKVKLLWETFSRLYCIMFVKRGNVFSWYPFTDIHVGASQYLDYTWSSIFIFFFHSLNMTGCHWSFLTSSHRESGVTSLQSSQTQLTHRRWHYHSVSGSLSALPPAHKTWNYPFVQITWP